MCYLKWELLSDWTNRNSTLCCFTNFVTGNNIRSSQGVQLVPVTMSSSSSSSSSSPSSSSARSIGLLRPLKDVTVTAGETATFECELSYEGIEVEWFLGGQKMEASERVSPVNQTSQGKVWFLSLLDSWKSGKVFRITLLLFFEAHQPFWQISQSKKLDFRTKWWRFFFECIQLQNFWPRLHSWYLKSNQVEIKKYIHSQNTYWSASKSFWFNSYLFHFWFSDSCFSVFPQKSAYTL